MSTSARLKRNHVFINCPFDAGYQPIFEAIVFTVLNLGFVARCAVEEDDAADFRLAKIERLIEECSFSVNDLSAVNLDSVTGLPRFNMPLELGLFLGCKRYGGLRQSAKRCLILDSDRYRYRAFLSDVAGQDIRAHGGSADNAIREVRDWLQAASGLPGQPGGGEMVRRHGRFRGGLAAICAAQRVEADRLTFLDLSNAIRLWLGEEG